MKNTLKKVTASVVTLMFALGLSLVAVMPASATASNRETFWEKPGTGEICVKVSPDPVGKKTLLAPTPDAGYSLTKVIVKAGSTGNSVPIENNGFYVDALYKYPVAGATWYPLAVLTGATVFAPEGKDISHVIYCEVKTPVTPPAAVLVTPKATFTQITCDAVGSYKLDSTDGVIWHVGEAVIVAGTYPVADTSTVTATATADAPKYKLTPGAQSEFPFSFVKPTDCGQLPVFSQHTPVATRVDRTCTTNGSYTLTAVEGIIYTVNGRVQDVGTYPVSTAKTVNVVASTVSSDFGIEQGVPSSWNFVFTEPSNCGQLTTLALPGSNGTLSSGLLLGLLFMVLGAGAMTVNHVRRRTN